MKTIWKFPLGGPSVQVEMPEGSRVIHVDEQGGVPTMWARVDSDRRQRARRFRIVGTGQAIDEEEAPFLEHLGTVKLSGGRLILHVFELVDYVTNV